METHDWGWVEARAAQTAQIWQQSAGIIAPPARRYSLEEQLVNEDAYDEALVEVEAALKLAGTEDRMVAAFGRFSSKALGLDPEATELLTEGFLPVGTSLARWARRFEARLSMAGIIQ